MRDGGPANRGAEDSPSFQADGEGTGRCPIGLSAADPLVDIIQIMRHIEYRALCEFDEANDTVLVARVRRQREAGYEDE